MQIVHSVFEFDAPKPAKLSKDRAAINAFKIEWKIKNNERLDKKLRKQL